MAAPVTVGADGQAHGAARDTPRSVGNPVRQQKRPLAYHEHALREMAAVRLRQTARRLAELIAATGSAERRRERLHGTSTPLPRDSSADSTSRAGMRARISE